MTSAGRARLVDRYDLLIFDLDGVVYLIDRPVPGAVEAASRLRAEGRSVAYVTNNASRRASEVADLLTGMGVAARPAEVLTSAAAAAGRLADRLPPGAPVLVVGAPALRAEIRAVGLVPVSTAAEKPVAVVQGYGRDVGWTDLAEAAVAVRSGAWWVATNTDRTLPSPRGPLPGNGALVAALRTALDREPDLVVGKPEPELFTMAAEGAGARRPLVIGDRLDTDIEGAVRAGMDSLLVLTGVHTAADVLAAAPGARPTYVSWNLAGLFDFDGVIRLPQDDGTDQPSGRSGSVGCEAGDWRVRIEAEGLLLTGSGTALAALTALCTAAWSAERVAKQAPQAGAVTTPDDGTAPFPVRSSMSAASPIDANGAARRVRVLAGSTSATQALAELGLVS